jgi:RNA polymerase sigma factor (sigma-70 family)
MMLDRLFALQRPKLATGQVVDVDQLDRWLDVPAARFALVAQRLTKAFLASRATVNVAAYRMQRAVSVSPLTIPDLPDVRGGFYQTELRRIPPMDRDEEFRMARRFEFVRGLVAAGLVAVGFGKASAQDLARRPTSEILAALATRKTKKGFDRAWFERVLDQHDHLRNLYVEGALYVVLGTVHRYRGLGVDAPDLIQEGNASLFQAIEGFDWRRDVRFRTYAQYWVHQAVLKALYNSARTVRIPIWVQKVLGKIRKVQEAGRREGRELTPAEIGARLDMPAERVEFVLGTRRYAVSLDAELSPGEGTSMAQSLADENLLPVPETVSEGNLRLALDGVMQDLPERERMILRRRFGLDGAEPETLGEIASDMGITAERVRQLQNAAIGRIKKPAKLRQLQAFVD